MKQLFLPCVLGALVLAAPAAAQTAEQPPVQSERCRAAPQGQDGQQKPAANSLSDTLDNCGGVLQPPPTGDRGMTAPPPDQGKTPVIKPGEVPAQPPKQ